MNTTHQGRSLAPVDDREMVCAPDRRPVPQVTALEHLAGYRVRFTFWDGTTGDLDLEPLLVGPIFEPLRRDPALFAQMYLDEDTIAWPNGADIAPETLYEMARGHGQ